MRTTVFNQMMANQTANALYDTGSYLVDFSRPRENWFTWKSGIQAPVYCNCRYLNTSYQAYDLCAGFFEEVIYSAYPDVQLIVGLATAGIPWAARVATRLHLPMSFVRSEMKAHGVGKLVECHPQKGFRAVIVDDLCSSGSSLEKAIDALQAEYQISTLGFVTITNWCFESMWTRFAPYNLRIHSLTSYPNILEAGVSLGKLSEAEACMLLDFYRSPGSYTWPLLGGEANHGNRSI